MTQNSSRPVSKIKKIIILYCTVAGALSTALVIIAAGIVLRSHFETDLSEKFPSTFPGIAAEITATKQPKNLNILVVHGIGEHCVGYADQFLRGIATRMNVASGQPFRQIMFIAKNRIRETAMKFVKQYAKAASLSDVEADSLENNLLDLRNSFRGPNAIEPLDTSEIPSNMPIQRLTHAQIANELHILLKYGLANADCEHNAFEFGKQKLSDDNEVYNSRRNTCEALNLFTEESEVNLKCYKLTLDFYEGDQVKVMVESGRGVPKIPPPPCSALERKKPQDSVENLDCAKTSSVDLGFLLVRTLRIKAIGAQVQYLRFYELTWDPATRWAKARYTNYDSDVQRDLVNSRLKRNVINDSISDAVMYLGNTQILIQYPLLEAFCKIVTDYNTGNTLEINSPSLNQWTEFRCSRNNFDVEKGIEYAENNNTIIVTHSLGTRILLDTLGMLTKDQFLDIAAERLKENYGYIAPDDINKMRHQFQGLRSAFIGSLRQVFALTNQIPLLELASLQGPAASQTPRIDTRDIGRNFETFLEKRGKNADPLEVVSFTDSNDLLSYSLRCWYQRYVLRRLIELKTKPPGARERIVYALTKCEDPEKFKTLLDEIWLNHQKRNNIKISEVSLRMRSWRLPLLFADPGGVHSNYFQDDRVIGFIACGKYDGVKGQSDCEETKETINE